MFFPLKKPQQFPTPPKEDPRRRRNSLFTSKGPRQRCPKVSHPHRHASLGLCFLFLGMKHANIANIIVPACEIFDNVFICFILFNDNWIWLYFLVCYST